jgi:predicted nucleotidyltransferase
VNTAQPPAEVREVADHLVESLGDDLGAILWQGSFARGEAKPDSDHDLIIVLKQIDDDALLRLRNVFQGRENWSTFVQSEEELRLFPADGRFQFHFGLQLLHGDFEPPPWTRENIIADLRALARNIRFECRYRLLHAEPEFSEMDEHYRGFLRARNARMLYYAAKLAVLALKSRAVLQGGAYPATHRELRAALAEAEDIAVLDLIENWPQPRETHPDITSVALQLDAFARRLVTQLPVGEMHA